MGQAQYSVQQRGQRILRRHRTSRTQWGTTTDKQGKTKQTESTRQSSKNEIEPGEAAEFQPASVLTLMDPEGGGFPV
ncbi:hypothetical protein SESBI_41300 [Sesbania bispinosa]|nr:hypothetical protein SESBI_41300 [Sesbania bispinosa]